MNKLRWSKTLYLSNCWWLYECYVNDTLVAKMYCEKSVPIENTSKCYIEMNGKKWEFNGAFLEGERQIKKELVKENGIRL